MSESDRDLNWLTFTERRAQITAAPYVTLQKRGGYTWNQAAFELAGKPTFVELLYEPTQRMVGFRPVAEETPNTYPVRKNNNSQTWLIAGEAFARRHKIPHDTARRFTAVKVGAVLAIQLDEVPDSNGPELTTTTPRITPTRAVREAPDDAQAIKVG